MLDLSTAVLCDFAQVRDRLLFVSSGAVSRLYRRELPSPLGLMVGLVIEVPLEESGVEHSLRAEVVNRHGDVLATLQNTFRVGDEGLFPHEVQQVPLVLSITGVRARTWGTHQVRLSLDEELVRALTLYIVPAAGVAPARPAPSTERAPSPQPGADTPAIGDPGADDAAFDGDTTSDDDEPGAATDPFPGANGDDEPGAATDPIPGTTADDEAGSSLDQPSDGDEASDPGSSDPETEDSAGDDEPPFAHEAGDSESDSNDAPDDDDGDEESPEPGHTGLFGRRRR
ncbi:MAG: DUF6941 family protein [Acidimicrobiales bacterium]